MLADRTSKILEAVVEDFIDTGEPISSGWLFRQHDFGIRPAMIRRELEFLSDERYLEQPHHSAGRIPTDRGYEFFASRVIGAKHIRVRGAEKLTRLLAKRNFREFFGEFSKNLGLAGAAISEKNTYKGGIENLVGSFDWKTPEEIKSIVRDFALLEESIKKLAGDFFSGGLKVFVGKKSPITQSECLAVIFGEYDDGAEKVAIAAIGPKRMDYKRAVGVFKEFQKNRQ